MRFGTQQVEHLTGLLMFIFQQSKAVTQLMRDRLNSTHRTSLVIQVKAVASTYPIPLRS
jgi:hypothetical protein